MPATATVTEPDLEALAALMAENPEFAAKLADAIAAKLDEKYGWQQGFMSDKMDELTES